MGNDLCPTCGVPMKLHNTCCGWDNANMVIHESEKIITASFVSEEEREIRWLISQSPNSDKLFKWFLNNRATSMAVNAWEIK